MDVRSRYDAAADTYAEHLVRALDHKPLYRQLLNRSAEAVAGEGLVVDLGCGPGPVAKYLSDRGVRVCGIDLSPAMVRVANRLCGGIEFRVGDMRHLQIADGSLAGIVAFYSIVHSHLGSSRTSS